MDLLPVRSQRPVRLVPFPTLFSAMILNLYSLSSTRSSTPVEGVLDWFARNLDPAVSATLGASLDVVTGNRAAPVAVWWSPWQLAVVLEHFKYLRGSWGTRRIWVKCIEIHMLFIVIHMLLIVISYVIHCYSYVINCYYSYVVPNKLAALCMEWYF